MGQTMPTQAPGNTKPIGLGGFVVGVIGIVAPVIASHMHAAPDIVAMIAQLSAYLQGGGLTAAYLGKPVTVKG